MALALAFPNIDPVLIEVGPIVIRWYALAYIAGLALGWWLARRLAKAPPNPMTQQQVDDFLLWATVGVVLGGRLGYVLFYNAAFYLQDPARIFEIWQGGMSFHGGFLGVVLAAVFFARRHKLPLFAMGDLIAVVAPIGLFFGRIANFINGELFGRPTDVPWAMVFPHGGPEPRHPSQLYEAGLEGLVLFVVMILLWWQEGVRQKPGTLFGVLLVGYGLARSVVELFREPDAHIGFLAAGVTMGQILSLPMIAIGLGFIFYARRKSP
ncbi:MAG: prolipoprotein diacylglyceryl transferase [Magnetospiraceae bacterium]